MVSRVKIVFLIIILSLIVLPVITSKSTEINVAKDNMKVAELGSYKVKTIKEILEPNKVSIFHYYSKDCLACERQHVELIDVKNAGLKNVNIIGIGSGTYSEQKAENKTDAYNNIYWDAYSDIAKKMQIIGTPTIFLVDSNGKVLRKYIGYIEAKDLLLKFDLQGGA